MDDLPRQPEPDDSGAQALDNVVRLPSEWIGSRDELVPIGRPDRELAREPAVELAPGAEDFWGEGSAAVQGALRAPAGYGNGLPSPSSSVDHGHRDPAEAGSALRATQARRLGAALLRFRPRWAWQSRRVPAAAAGLVAGVLLIVAVVGVVSSGGPKPGPVAASRASSGAVAAARSTSSMAASITPGAHGNAGPAGQTGKNPSVRLRHDGTRRAVTRQRVSRHVARQPASTPRGGTRPGVRRNEDRRGGVSRATGTRHAHSTPATTQQAPVTFASSPSTPSSPPAPSPSSETGVEANGSSTRQSPSATVSGAPAGPTGPSALVGAGTSPSG